MDNRIIAKHLTAHAERLEKRESGLYRARAYRRAAETVLGLDYEVTSLLSERGRNGLEELPYIGAHIAYTIETLVLTGEFHTFDEQDADRVDVQRMLTSLPGIGKHMAQQLRDRLGIERLEDLERAAHSGRLAELGIGPKRLRGLMDTLANRLSPSNVQQAKTSEPSVGLLLAIDQEYRNMAYQRALPTVPTRRFISRPEPSVPLYQISRDGWYFKASFAKSAIAHRLGQTSDWVEISFDNGEQSSSRTIVTETRGDLRGRRVIRGREQECRARYAGTSAGRLELV